MTNEDLKGKLNQALDKLGYVQDISDLEQNPRLQKFINTLKNIQDLRQLQEATNIVLDFLDSGLHLDPLYSPKILEVILNHGLDVNSYPKKLNWIGNFHMRRGTLFGHNTTFIKKDKKNVVKRNIGYDVAHTLTVSIARIMLQNPNLLAKQEYWRDGTKNLLYSAIETIFVNLNSQGEYCSYDEPCAQRESFKHYLSLLLTLMVLVSPKSLDQKCYDRVSIHANHLEREKTPIMVFSAYLLSNGGNHPHMQELYDNFKQIIKLTQDDNHVLSQKIKELINYVSSIKPNSKIDDSKLQSIVSEIEDQIKTQGNSPAKKCIVDVGNLLIENLPTILLDRYISNLRSPDYQDALKRELLTIYQNNGQNGKDVTGSIPDEEKNKISLILEKEIFRTIELLSKKSTDINDVVNHIKDSSAQRLIEKHEEDLLKLEEDFLKFKEFLDDNPAPHEPILKERLHRKAQGKALMDIGAFFERHEEEYLSKLESEKAQEAGLARIIESEKALKAVLADMKARTSIIEMIAITIGIAFVSIMIGLAFESFIAAIAVAAFLTIAAYCVDRYQNPKVDSQLTSPQTEENTLELAV
ncbi:hypothetical protein [Wolbachia endosymbiont of Folsomia candida]|uniref:hypothetical protein n=1 Tax=Wolbachia endosymbiont of Folsomia candida TaxID=169402 RepID=UPI000AB5133E|nr:hypothetical protein [Wolbachia endosymbiont of Folsomia candida]APR98847.1 hypothetical protein ASM33_06525 [Wolbachia endosymbiont of Folsomia candida]